VVDQYRDERGETALHKATRQGSVPIIQCLLDHKANINGRSTYEHISPLMIACKQGYIHVVQFLLEHKAKINLVGSKDNKMTALMMACKKGHEPCVVLLLEHGADISLRNKNGYTAKDLAQAERHDTIVQLITRLCLIFTLKIRFVYMCVYWKSFIYTPPILILKMFSLKKHQERKQ